MANTAERLKEYMNTYHIRQVDILNRCKSICVEKGVRVISKSQLSDWIHGRYEPNQWNLHVLSEALDVQETWLMGYDVPMRRKTASAQADADIVLIDKFDQLTDTNKKIVMNLIDNLIASQHPISQDIK